MINKSGLKPAGRAVLIKPYQPERKQSMIVMPDEVANRDQSIEQRAIVIEVGPSAWCDEICHRAKPGDKVLVSKFAGFVAIGTSDGERYRFINDRDIFALIEVENNG
jgi:co-chaperonin GroES (HSP10)